MEMITIKRKLAHGARLGARAEPMAMAADPPAVISGRLRLIRAGRARGGAGPDSVINCIAVSRPNCVVVRKKRVGVVSRPELRIL